MLYYVLKISEKDQDKSRTIPYRSRIEAEDYIQDQISRQTYLHSSSERVVIEKPDPGKVMIRVNYYSDDEDEDRFETYDWWIKFEIFEFERVY